MSDDFSDISDGEVVSVTQLIEELYGDDTDADMIIASQQFGISYSDRFCARYSCGRTLWQGYGC